MGEQKNGGLASSAGPSRLSGSRLKWRLNQMRLGSAQIGASSGSGSSQRLAGAAATLDCTDSAETVLSTAHDNEPEPKHTCLLPLSANTHVPPDKPEERPPALLTG